MPRIKQPDGTYIFVKGQGDFGFTNNSLYDGPEPGDEGYNPNSDWRDIVEQDDPRNTQGWWDKNPDVLRPASRKGSGGEGQKAPDAAKAETGNQRRKVQAKKTLLTKARAN